VGKRKKLAISRRELERLEKEAERGDEVAREILDRWRNRKGMKWYDIALIELMVEEGVEIELTSRPRREHNVNVAYMESRGRGNSGESEWMVFEDFDDAEEYAEAYVKEMLEDEPSMFNQDWLSDFVTIDDTTKETIADEESESYIDDQDEDDLLDDAGMLDVYEELQERLDEIEEEVDEEDADTAALWQEERDIRSRMEYLIEDARQSVGEQMFQHAMERMEDVQEFLNELGYDSYPDFVTFDLDAAAKSAINVDGVAHFLDRYDGSEIELPSDAVAFGIN
jgi:hypothetical protein